MEKEIPWKKKAGQAILISEQKDFSYENIIGIKRTSHTKGINSSKDIQLLNVWLVFFCLFRAAPLARGSSQARG